MPTYGCYLVQVHEAVPVPVAEFGEVLPLGEHPVRLCASLYQGTTLVSCLAYKQLSKFPAFKMAEKEPESWWLPSPPPPYLVASVHVADVLINVHFAVLVLNGEQSLT